MKKVLFIFHAKAGKGSIGNHLQKIFQTFCNLDCVLTVYMTRYSGHATEIVEEFGPEYDMILAAGGDGTLNEIVSGVLKLQKPLPIAYIPAGTVNDFASSLGLPKNPGKCLEHIARQNTVTVDAGLLGEKPFIYVAAFGTPVKVAYTTPQNEKNVWGYSAYVANVLKELPRSRQYHLRITNHGEVTEGEYMFGFITNSNSVSGIRGVAGKRISLNDGLFEVTLIRNIKNPVDMTGTLANILVDDPDEEFIQRFKTDELLIESDEGIEWCTDGEFGGVFQNVHFKVLNNAVTFFA